MEIFEKIKEGDSSAFIEIYEKYNQIYFRVLDKFRRNLEKRGDFQELQQNAMSLIYDWSLSYDSLRASFSTYLYNKTYWQCLQTFRKEKLTYSYNTGAAEIQNPQDYCVYQPESFSVLDCPSGHFLVEKKDALATIREEWNFDKNGKIFNDRWILGYGLEEAGKRNGRTGESVRKVCEKERERLKLKFKQEEF